MTTPVETTGPPVEPETVPGDQVGTETPPGSPEPSEGDTEPVDDQVEQDDQETPEPDPADTGDQEPHDLKTARGEAARQRREKQEALSKLSETQAALDASRRAHAESLLPDGALSVRSDLWFDGATVDQVLDESGNVSRELVRALADQQVNARPGLGRGTTPSHGGGGNASAVNGYRRVPGGASLRTSDGWDSYDEEKKKITSLYDAAQSTRAGELRDTAVIKRIKNEHPE